MKKYIIPIILSLSFLFIAFPINIRIPESDKEVLINNEINDLILIELAKGNAILEFNSKILDQLIKVIEDGGLCLDSKHYIKD